LELDLSLFFSFVRGWQFVLAMNRERVMVKDANWASSRRGMGRGQGMGCGLASGQGDEGEGRGYTAQKGDLVLAIGTRRRKGHGNLVIVNGVRPYIGVHLGSGLFLFLVYWGQKPGHVVFRFG
jgi:hypothetical protein